MDIWRLVGRSISVYSLHAVEWKLNQVFRIVLSCNRNKDRELVRGTAVMFDMKYFYFILSLEMSLNELIISFISTTHILESEA